jgi:hypothetical protein
VLAAIGVVPAPVLQAPVRVQQPALAQVVGGDLGLLAEQDQPVELGVLPGVAVLVLSRRTSKCRCGPVEKPLEPTRPTSAPAGTSAPSATAAEERWA